MSGNGAIQLTLNDGPQDRYLTENPVGTFFQHPSRKYFNFAMEAIKQTFLGTADFGKDAQVIVSRAGDFITKAYLEVDLPVLTGTGNQAWTRNIGHVLLKKVWYNVGSTTVCELYTELMQILSELTRPTGHSDAVDVLIGNTAELTTLAPSIPQRTLIIPLLFDWCRDYELAFPLIALANHEFKIYFQFREFNQCYITDGSSTVTNASLISPEVWVDYIYMDAAERRRVAVSPHEFIVEQFQTTGRETWSTQTISQPLYFNQPVSCLYACSVLNANTAGGANRWTDFTDSGTGSNHYTGNNPISTAVLQYTGKDRFAERKGMYFNYVQPLQHFPNACSVGTLVYSFALVPNTAAPSGSLNFSRVDNSSLRLSMVSAGDRVLIVFAANHNVIRMAGGVAGLGYSS